MSKLTKQLVFSAMAIALATVISTFIKLPSLPFGGSVTLFSMLVICLPGYWYGARAGLLAAFVYGILQFLIGPYVVHPAQVILDYPLAFGALGISGLFASRRHGLTAGYLCGVLGRFFFHQLSGLIFYTAYVGDFAGNLAAIWASTVYNLSYLVPEAAATLLLLALPPVRQSLARIRQLAV